MRYVGKYAGNYARHLAVLGAVLLAGAPLAAARNNSNSAASAANARPDRIDVIAHMPLSGGPVLQLTAGDHWRRDYLYLEQGRGVSILDVTNAAAPKPAGTLDVPPPEANGSLTAVVGTAALVTTSANLAAPAQASALPPRTVSIMSFTDPEHPKVEQQFNGVTAILKDPSRGLVYLTNAEGLWVLKMDPARDRELEQEYDRYILYSH